LETVEQLSNSNGSLSRAKREDRMEWIDYAKGLAIILVAFRHTLAGINGSGIDVPDFLYQIQEFVLNFRMPVFFMISGVFLERAMRKTTPTTLIKQKSGKLLYPYLLWAVVFITIQILFSTYINTVRTYRDYAFILTQPRKINHMWYLLALFNANLLFILVSPYLLKNKKTHIVFAIILHLLAYVVKDYSILSDLLYHYIFLMLGAMFSEKLFAQQNMSKDNLWQLLAIIPVFIAGQLTWLKMSPGSFYIQPLLLVIILVACFFFYMFCRVLYAYNIFRGLSFIGKYSLYIYILHFLVISAFRVFSIHFLHLTNVYFIVFTGLILGISLPIIIYRTGKKFGIELLFSLEPKKKLI